MAVHHKLREFLLFMVSLVFLWLLLAGIGGISYEIFRDNSVVTKAGGRFFDYLWDRPVMLIPTAIGALAVGYFWRRGDFNPHKKHPPFITFVLVLLVITGGYYTYKLFHF